MTPLYLDIETYCDTPITNGTHRYAESAEIIMWQYAIGDGEVQLRDHDEDTSELLTLLADTQYEIVIQNSAFDRTVMRHRGVVISTSRIFDTMACAMAHSLPSGLGQLCEILGVPTDKTKDKEGKTWIQLFCKPQPKGRKIHRATKHTHPVEWQRFREYGKLDVIAMREIYKRLPRWNFKGAERALWELDQKINDRGVAMDLELAHAAIRASERAKQEYADETLARTEGAVTSTTRRDQLIDYMLEAYGVMLPDMTAATLERRIDDPDLPLPLRELLAIRLQATKTSVSKYKRVINGVSEDGRLRGLLVFCGASRTGRFAGRLLQPQNLPRPTMSELAIERGIQELKADAAGLI
jgi:DNA polymerase